MGLGGSALRATTTAASVEVSRPHNLPTSTSKSLWHVAHSELRWLTETNGPDHNVPILTGRLLAKSTGHARTQWYGLGADLAATTLSRAFSRRPSVAGTMARWAAS